MSDCNDVLRPCFCMTEGYLKPECGSRYAPEYKWAVDKLVEEFGTNAVRVSWETDYGRRRELAVSQDWPAGFVRHPLRGDTDTGRYDLNDHKDDLDRFIERARPAMRGFGL